MNFQPFGVLVQALRNTSVRLRGYCARSASRDFRPTASSEPLETMMHFQWSSQAAWKTEWFDSVLPQYSPDLNPIEMPFSKLKACNYFRHAGYA
jgi:hypothetical protein